MSCHIPTHIKEHSIYDVYYNDNNQYVFIVAFYTRSFPSIYIEDFDESCNIHVEKNPRIYRHTVIYTFDHDVYKPYLNIRINDVLYKNISIKRYPKYENKVIASTLVKHEEAYIRQWIKYHLFIGIQHFIIYDNTDISCTLLTDTLRDFIMDDIVCVIKWNYPYWSNEPLKSRVIAQPCQQNHSLYAFQNASYICFTDVDEYINIHSSSNILEALKLDLQRSNTLEEDIFGFRLLNRFFYNPNNYETSDFSFLFITECHHKVNKGGHFKCILKPKQTRLICVHHAFSDSKKIHILNPNYIIMNHYYYLNKEHRGKNETTYKDDSIIQNIQLFMKTIL